MGGRCLSSVLVDREVPATCDPLGPENKLVFAPGYLTGTPLVNTCRISVGTKSPLTGGIKESNAGGTVATALARTGTHALIIEGQAPREELYLLKIDADGTAELIDARTYRGVRTYTLVEQLTKVYGAKKSISCIGPAGEFQLRSASIQTTDLDGRPCRAAARGGVGAVMGSKGLKAIVIDRTGKARAPLADARAFREASRQFAIDVKGHPDSGEFFPELGTAGTVLSINEAGAFPTRNAREGQFEGAEKISGENMAQLIKQRGGKTTHKGCPQCIIDCSNVFVDTAGEYVTSSLEYETIWSMGAMQGIDDLDTIAKLDFLCDDIGLDTINTGVAVAVAMDAGFRPFGDTAAAIEMVEEVAHGSEIGRAIGNGPDAAGEYFCHDRVPTVKGQSISAYDPRAIQGMAVTYATCPQGADHTAGWTIAANLPSFGGTVHPHRGEGQAEVSRNKQISAAAEDSIGLCQFANTGMETPEGRKRLFDMMAAKSGRPFGEAEWRELGLKVLRAEREFNRNAGLTKEDDRLPSMFYEEPLPPHNVVVKVTDEDMDTTFDF
jgi:aldehyde:ferredoxin oxidoreductase